MEVLDTVIDQLATAHEQRALSRQLDFLKLAREIVDDKKPPTIDRVEAVLAGAGKTSDDLRAAVENYRKRKAWAAQFKAGIGMEQDRANLEKRQAASESELAAARLKHEKTMQPIIERLVEIENAERAGSQAADYLSRTCTNPEVAEKLRQNSLRNAAICPKLNWARKAIAARREGEFDLAEGQRLSSGGLGYVDRGADYRQRGQARIDEANEAEKVIGELQKEFDACQAEEVEIRKLALIP